MKLITAAATGLLLLTTEAKAGDGSVYECEVYGSRIITSEPVNDQTRGRAPLNPTYRLQEGYSSVQVTAHSASGETSDFGSYQIIPEKSGHYLTAIKRDYGLATLVLSSSPTYRNGRDDVYLGTITVQVEAALEVRFLACEFQ